MQSLPVLACTSCGVPLPTNTPDCCERCGMTFEVVDGDIVSFLPPGAGSALDDIDYDAIYKVDGGASDNLFRQCRNYLGSLLPAQAESYLEIGAGTGLFTLAYLSDAQPKHALITDVSAKMLATCRQRLETREVGAHTEVSYALWDGTTRCFRDKAFDLVAGFSVLHHVLDYQGMLDILRDTLTDGRPRGVPRAQPRLPPGDDRLHVRRDPDHAPGPPGVERRGSRHHRIVDQRELRQHQVPRRRAGTGIARGQAPVRRERPACRGDPRRVRPVPRHSLRRRERGVAHRRRLHGAAAHLPGDAGAPAAPLRAPDARPFVFLSAEDRAPSFLIVLERGGAGALGEAGQADAATSSSPAVADVAFRHPDPDFRYSLEFFFTPDPESGLTEVTAKGWIFGDVDIRQVEVGEGVRFPVAGLRMDVEGIMNSTYAYPLQRVLCCGLMEVRPQFLDASSGREEAITVLTMAGERHVLGRFGPGSAYLHLEHMAGESLERVDAPA
jgi:SAM-dependent methyltransferase